LLFWRVEEANRRCMSANHKHGRSFIDEGGNTQRSSHPSIYVVGYEKRDHVWPAQHKSDLCRNVTILRLIRHQRANLLLIRMVYFFNWTSLRKVMSFWMWTRRKLISIVRGTYNTRKFWTRRTSGSVRRQEITWKYAYKNLALHSGSPTHSVVMHVRSNARDRSSRIDYWTLNSHNVNSMFVA